MPIGSYYPDRESPQTPADVAVVIPSILRKAIVKAIDCVYRQELGGRRVQILIGADINGERARHLDKVFARRPDHVSGLVLTLPYSTSTRHGGLHPARDGGALRTMLSFAANARYIAYLDDDNDWTPDHLSRLLEAIEGKAWAFSQRMLIAEESGEELGVDRWDSVGANRGRFAEGGGLVDPSCLMIDKLIVTAALWLWSDPFTENGKAADRRFFQRIARVEGGEVPAPTCRYKVRTGSVLREFMRTGVEFP